LESSNEYRYTSTAGVFGDRWASLIQPVPEVAEPANAVAAAGMPSSRADVASSMSNRLVIL
jgi:hypothetical protein